MSELIDNRAKRKDLLKHMIRQLHEGVAPEQVKAQLARLLGEIPYDDVVEVEQDLISDGLPAEEILKLCDIHTEVLKGQIDQSGAKEAPPGHPVHTFKKENEALNWELSLLRKLFRELEDVPDKGQPGDLMAQIQGRLHALADVEKHYQRKENLLFPYLEKHGITGPPTVMWGKHDETRDILKTAVKTAGESLTVTAGEAKSLVNLAFEPAAKSIEDMIYKEENILFPMCMDTLTETEWYNIYRQSPEIGFCLYDPEDSWTPKQFDVEAVEDISPERIQLPSGSLTPTELNAILNTIPFDLTFVDKDDTVRYFTQGRERIFARNRAILGRKVQMCHPPSSVHVVEQILADFKSGRQNQAPFWINFKDRFIHIEYFALRDEAGEYLGTLEVSQDLTEKRSLQGEQRLLQYAKGESDE